MVVEMRDDAAPLAIVLEPKHDLLPPLWERRHIAEAELRSMSDSLISVGFINAIVCTRDKRIVAGCRRWRASLLKDTITHVPVRYVDDLSAVDHRIYRISENVQRKDYAIGDMCEEIEGLMEERPGTTQKDAARLLNIDPSTVTRFLSFRKLIPAVQAVADELGIKAMYEFSKESPERQAERLAKKRAGGAAESGQANGDGTVQSAVDGSVKAHHGNGTVRPAATGNPKPAETASDAGKAATISIFLPSGKRVVIHGVATPGEALGLLTKATKQAREGKLLDRVRFEELCRKESEAADAKAATRLAGPEAEAASILPLMQEGG